MIQLSQDPRAAEQQMRALLFYLLAFGYIDGDFDASEQAFIERAITDLTRSWAEERVKDPVRRQQVIQRFEARFKKIFALMNGYIQDLFTESVTDEEDLTDFVYTKLKLRTFELFCDFDRENQERLLSAADALILADDIIHPAEIQFREEIEALLEGAPEQLTPTFDEDAPDLSVPLSEGVPPTPPPANVAATEAFLRPLEHHFASNVALRGQQVATDCALIRRTLESLEARKKASHGLLRGKQHAEELKGEGLFLDQSVYGLWPEPDRDYELIVLGDLHGCYSCLKAALVQSDFINRVRAFQRDPERHPDVKLVLLGDYIDRGFFSFSGVLRALLKLHVEFPEHVLLLRGNHEHYVEREGELMSKVIPAEAMKRLAAHLPRRYFEDYKTLFDTMPCVAFFERIIFVHAGIPRDNVFHAGWRGLSSLNSPRINFQMRWSDPSDVDHVPGALQVGQTRFSFGQRQFEQFMSGIGCHTMIRGHERILEGAKTNFHRNGFKMITLFSAGGLRNNDLPARSGYRRVTPRAMTLRYRGGVLDATTWLLDYERFNQPSSNAFFSEPPEL